MAAPPPPPMWQPQQAGIDQILQLLTEYRQPGANQQQVRRAVFLA
jgi:transportin-1